MKVYSLEITKKLDWTDNLEPNTVDKFKKKHFLTLSNILNDFANNSYFELE